MMITKEEAFSKAFQIKRDALNLKTAEFENSVAKLKLKDKEYAEICSKLSSLGARIAITALSGDKDALDKLKKEITSLNKKREAILEKNGIGEIEYDCPLCKDTGYISGKICDCTKKIAKAITMKSLSEDLPLDGCRFDNFSLDYYPESDNAGNAPKKRMVQILKLCTDYVAKFNPATSQSILFMGESGLGKTHLSLAVVYELIQKGFDVLYGSSYNLFSAMEAEHFSSNSKSGYDAAINCDLLVIDDLGTEFTSPFVQSLLYNVINTRILSHKPVIISTNLSMQEIEAKYSPKISSRLIGEYTAKRFLGTDIRQQKAAAKQTSQGTDK